MKPISLTEVASYSGGQLVRGNGERNVTRVSTDTRDIRPGDLFVALKGDKFDGHDYASVAAEKGALAMIAEQSFDDSGVSEDFALILVQDTLVGLQQLAKGYRASLPTKIIAVTGSNGKTSTKEMIAAALSADFNIHKTPGNLNNHIGVPLTLLGLEEKTDWAVMEVGMNHPGEIGPLANLIMPDITVVTGIGWVHVEAFDSREAIAEEKGDLVRSLSKSGLAVLNGEDPFLKPAKDWTEAELVRVGREDHCEFQIGNIQLTGDGTEFSLTYGQRNNLSVKIPFFGSHMVSNAGLAACAAIKAGATPEAVENGLGAVELPGGRLKLSRWEEGWLLDDTYNASPDSMVAGMDSLCLLQGGGRRVALLGSMAELGSYSENLHHWVGKEAVDKGMELIAAIGPFAEEYRKGALEAGLDPGKVVVCENHEDVARFYLKHRLEDDAVFVKGSRSMAMERVVSLIMKRGSE
ncbi:MAG: UDP-N-acetylmuramoyl-tripeptide--D-alanyl-D-alanine ligase [Verrucomicrobiota bacterium]